MAKRNKTKKKRLVKSKKVSSNKPIVQVNVNVQAQQAPKQQPNKRERVKRIQSRQRPNLREMRRGMLTQAQAQGGGGASPFANPAFYGNVKMLTDSAMNQFQNQRYGLEQQIRDSGSEQKALLAAGKNESAQLVANTQQQLTQQLANWQKQFGFGQPGLEGPSASVLPVAAAAGAANERARALQQEKDERLAQEAAQRAAIEQAQTQAAIEKGEEKAFSNKDVDAAILKIAQKARPDRDWTPGAIKPATRERLDGPVRKYLNFPEGSAERTEAEEQIQQTIGKTYRATGRDKRGPRQQEADTSVQFDLEVNPQGEGTGVRSASAGGGTSYVVETPDREEEDWDVSGVGDDLLSPATRSALNDTEASVQYFSGGEDPDESNDL
jgi:hypothetical protein